MGLVAVWNSHDVPVYGLHSDTMGAFSRSGIVEGMKSIESTFPKPNL